MRNVVVGIALSVVLVPVAANAADTWSDPYPGVRRLHRTSASQNVNVLVVDLCAPGVSVRATASGERGRTVSSFGTLVGAQAAVNGDFFSSGYNTDGPAVGGGGSWGGGDHGYVTPAQFGAGQVALPEHGDTGGVQPWAKEVVSGHPTLLFKGQVRGNNGDSLCTARHPRTALGFSADQSKLYLAVIDGRATGRIGMTCDEMIGLFQGLGASDAVNLDGGGSSAMWLANAGVLNYPSDGSQRVVGNHLAIRATGSGGATHCPKPAYDAALAAKQAPAEMSSGDEGVAWVDFTNLGRTTWDLANTRLGTQAPQDRASPFFKAGNWMAPNRASPPDHSNYGPDAVGRFSFVMLAPEVSQTTVFDETFQPVQEGVTWFGAKVTFKITVHPRSGATSGDGSAVGSEDGGAPPGGPGVGSGGGQPMDGAAGCSLGGRVAADPLLVALALTLALATALVRSARARRIRLRSGE
jgi:hypothetical protein